MAQGSIWKTCDMKDLRASISFFYQ